MSRHRIAGRNTFVWGEIFIYGITYSEIPARPHREECVKAKDTRGRPLPYFGYYYRILRAQGADAPGGAYDYVVRGKMIGGFALVAYPGNWGNSGVMTFIVNHDGVVYQKDLGPDMAAAARAITRFDPDSTWTRL